MSQGPGRAAWPPRFARCVFGSSGQALLLMVTLLSGPQDCPLAFLGLAGGLRNRVTIQALQTDGDADGPHLWPLAEPRQERCSPRSTARGPTRPCGKKGCSGHLGAHQAGAQHDPPGTGSPECPRVNLSPPCTWHRPWVSGPPCAPSSPRHLTHGSWVVAPFRKREGRWEEVVPVMTVASALGRRLWPACPSLMPTGSLSPG